MVRSSVEESCIDQVVVTKAGAGEAYLFSDGGEDTLMGKHVGKGPCRAIL